MSTIQANTVNTQTYEIFDAINNLAKTDKAAAINFARSHRSKVVLEQYLKMNYDPNIVFQLPAGQPPFKMQKDVPDGYCLTDLKQELRRMRVFTDQALNLTKVRREALWLQMCEGLFWKEAVLINKIKDRRITDMYDQLTPEFVKEAFPSLLQDFAAPVPEEAIAPVEYGDDPSKISEEELIKKSVAAFLEEVEKENPVKKEKAGKKGGTATADQPPKRGRGRPPKLKTS